MSNPNQQSKQGILGDFPGDVPVNYSPHQQQLPQQPVPKPPTSPKSTQSKLIEPEETCPYDLTKPHITRAQIVKLLDLPNYRIRNISLYQRALVHDSIQKYLPMVDKSKVQKYLLQSNEQMEFLGDSTLGLISAHYLFQRFRNKGPGFLTRIRSKMVRSKILAELAKMINLGQHILMSKNTEEHNSGRTNTKILEDAFEALLCAIYLDQGGFEGDGIVWVNTFYFKLFEQLDFNEMILKDDNYKDIILRYTQANKFQLPVYEVIETTGEMHDRQFKVQIKINGEVHGQGYGKSKKAAEQFAAKFAIEKLGIVDKRNEDLTE